MSYRIRDINTIHNNPLNTSVSKQQYSIPKAKRFRNNKSEMGYKYYDMPSTNAQKAPTFGISIRKTIFAGDKDVPSPDKYFVKDMKQETQQISFAKGRNVLNLIKIVMQK